MTFGHGVFDSFGADTLTFGAETNYGPATISVTYHNNEGQYKAGARRYLVSGKFHEPKTLGNKTYPAGHTFSYARDSLASAKSATSGTTGGKYKVTEVWESDLNTAWPTSGRDSHTVPTLKVFTVKNSTKVEASIAASTGSWGAWSDWSECKSCKQRRSRTRTINRRAFGVTEDTRLEEHEENDCGRVDEELSDWSDWSVCADDVQTRTRSIVTASACGGSPSTDPATHTESQACTVEVIDDGDDGTTDTDTDTTITAQSTTVTPVVASAGMSGTMKGLLAVGVLGGGFLYMKSKKGKKPIA